MASTLFGLAQLDPNAISYVTDVDKDLLFTATQEYLNQALDALASSENLFIEEQTSLVSERYELPMGGVMERVAHGAEPTPLTTRGGWDVSYPIYKASAMIAGTKEDIAQMTPDQYQKNVDGLITSYAARKRTDIMTAIFNDSSYTFTDERRGSLTVQPLANSASDSVQYPPAIGSQTGARRSVTAYAGTDYTSANVSDSNNPTDLIRAYFKATFGAQTGGLPIYAFVNGDTLVSKIKSLTEFRPVPVAVQTLSQDTEYLGIYEDLIGFSGEVIGAVGNVVYVEWEYIPDDYIYSQYMRAAAPLKMRVYPDNVGMGLGTGGLLVPEAKQIDDVLDMQVWKAYFGFGVGNRLNGYVLHVTDDTAYTVPTEYAR